jgi:hypothetical protein
MQPFELGVIPGGPVTFSGMSVLQGMGEKVARGSALGASDLRIELTSVGVCLESQLYQGVVERGVGATRPKRAEETWMQ